MKKTKIERLYSIESKLYNRYDNKNYHLTKERILKVQIEILVAVAVADELFFNEVEEALKNGWAGSLQETSNFADLIEEARNGDAGACGMLRNVYKPNDSFKKETARFKNV
jgi:hypothetical protein